MADPMAGQEANASSCAILPKAMAAQHNAEACM